MTVASLETLAGEIAAQLVAKAMHAMVHGAVTVTVHPVARRALPPAPKIKRGYTKRQPKAPAPVVPLRASKSTDDLDLAHKRCRKCHALGTGVRLPGAAKAVKCSSCGFTWQARAKRTAGKSAPEQVRCVRCDHGKDEHDLGGRCLSVRCVCKEFAA